MGNVFMTAKERIEKAKLELKKAQDRVKKLEEQRKLEIVNLLFKIRPDLGDFEDAALEKAFKDVLDKLK